MLSITFPKLTRKQRKTKKIRKNENVQNINKRKICFLFLIWVKRWLMIEMKLKEKTYLYERQQFFKLDQIQAKNIKTIRFKDQEIDEDFCIH
jgi:hypothetical protein